MVHVAVNKYDFEKNQHFRVRFWGGGGGHQKAYAVYAFINVDNCERPLIVQEVVRSLFYSFFSSPTIHRHQYPPSRATLMTSCVIFLQIVIYAKDSCSSAPTFPHEHYEQVYVYW